MKTRSPALTLHLIHDAENATAQKSPRCLAEMTAQSSRSLYANVCVSVEQFNRTQCEDLCYCCIIFGQLMHGAIISIPRRKIKRDSVWSGDKETAKQSMWTRMCNVSDTV